MPRDMYAKAHLVDGPEPPAPTRDPQEILREASAQAVGSGRGHPANHERTPDEPFRHDASTARAGAAGGADAGGDIGAPTYTQVADGAGPSSPSQNYSHCAGPLSPSQNYSHCAGPSSSSRVQSKTESRTGAHARNAGSRSDPDSGTSPTNAHMHDAPRAGEGPSERSLLNVTSGAEPSGPPSLVDMRLLREAASQEHTHTVAATLPAEAFRAVAGGPIQSELVSADVFQARVAAFESEGYQTVDETVLPGCTLEVGNEGRALLVHIRDESVNALHDPLRFDADRASADRLLDASTPEELAAVVASIMWTEAELPRESHASVEDSHVRYKPEDAVSLVHQVPGKRVVSPGATPEMVQARDREHTGEVPRQVHSLLTQLGVTEKHFKAEFSEWDKQHAVRFQYRPQGEPPPQEHRKIARGLLEAVAEQLRAFMKAGWIYRIYEAETCAPIVVVPKKDGSVRITIDYSTINKQLLPRAWSMPDVTETIHQLKDMAKESYRQIKANRAGTRNSQADDDPDSGQRAGIGVDDLEDPGMSRIGKTDVQKAFHRVLVDERDRPNLAFSAPQLGLFTWRVLPMGAAQSPAAWCSVSTKMLDRAGILYNPGGHDQALVRDYLQELYKDMVENDWLIDGFELRNGELFIDGYLSPTQFGVIYVDDLTTVSAAPEGSFGMEGDAAAMHEHLRQWKLLIAVCRHQRLFLAGSKTCVGCEIIQLLGLCVSHTEVFADPDRVKAFNDIPEPTTKSDCRCFCGLGNFYRNFCELFAVILSPIYALTKDDVPDKDVTAHFTIPLPDGDPRAATHFGVKADEHKLDADGRYAGRVVKRVEDNDDKDSDLSCREAWQLVKDRMCELTLLAQPDISKPMTIFTDSSQYAGAGAIANELTPGTLRIFDVWSRNFTPEQRNYSASEREALAIVLSVKKWYTWVCAAVFTIRMRTDHMALINARQKINNARITSWFAQLAALDFTISYVRGTSPLLLVPDALSRLVRSYTDEELREQWVEGEHLLKVPCFEKIYRKMQPIHTHRGVDT